jgi:hypothetical protein
MKRQFIQIVLMSAMLCGATSQALACVSWQSDSHSCCRILSTSQALKARLAAKTKRQPAPMPPCCTVSVPVAPQQAATHNRAPQPNATALMPADQSNENCFVVNLTLKPKPLSEPAGYSPPPFILHHALLI